MSDPQRLAELERQRALIVAHLQWLDDQIANERHTLGRAAPPPSPTGAMATSVLPGHGHDLGASAAPEVAPPGAITEPDALPLHEAGALPSKWGCWIAFAAMMVGLGLALGLYIYFGYARAG